MVIASDQSIDLRTDGTDEVVVLRCAMLKLALAAIWLASVSLMCAD